MQIIIGSKASVVPSVGHEWLGRDSAGWPASGNGMGMEWEWPSGERQGSLPNIHRKGWAIRAWCVGAAAIQSQTPVEHPSWMHPLRGPLSAETARDRGTLVE
jgi:hypothetical protein